MASCSHGAWPEDTIARGAKCTMRASYMLPSKCTYSSRVAIVAVVVVVFVLEYSSNTCRICMSFLTTLLKIKF
jgi:hypothetical protein